MFCTKHDRNKAYSILKKARGDFSNKATTSTLHTPVGTYYGEDVLEGFAADAEFLGKQNDVGSRGFDKDLYTLVR